MAHILQVINDTFNWLESTGILAALGTLILLVFKQLQPYLKTHIKDKQMAQLTDFALATVTKFAQLSSLSKSDRKKAALQDATNFAKQMGLNWATPEMIDSIVEAAYQQFKQLGYDNHQPVTTDEPAQPDAQDGQSPAQPAEPAAQSTDNVAQPREQAPQPTQPTGSDQNA
ncbi:phage holin, LLH family [Lentilactobacillus buchneri]|uniref:phage holin, LLH family n=1 Tax=Lentilactobacillus buchneri TaxID=1581 RepID=UPI0021A53810|nr:phage holin, LLH family [Lentilactobacillus buchneri]MCT2881902.1 hypothetical protein [Lentilactobacillus buchneri]